MEGIEILIRNVKLGTSSTDLKRFLAPLLENFQILVFEIRIFKPKREVTKTGATLTTHKAIEGVKFVQHYQSPNVLLFGGKKLAISRSNQEPNEFLVRVLRREEKELLLEGYDVPDAATSPGSVGSLRRQFGISLIACGNWEYVGPWPHYRPYYELPGDATATFGDRCFVLEYKTEIAADDQSFEALHYSPITKSDSTTNHYRVRFHYSSIVSIVLDRQEDPSVICTLTEAPKIWANGIRAIGLKGLPLEVSTSCQVYRLRLSDPSDISHLLHLDCARAFPQSSVLPVKHVCFDLPFVDQINKMKMELEENRHSLTFPIKFQIQKLAQNGYLSPRVVLALVGYISYMQKTSGPASTVAALRRLFQQLPYAGPSTKAADLETRTYCTATLMG